MRNIRILALRLSLITILLFFMMGCGVIPARNISNNPSLGNNEGILITKIRTNIKDSKILLHEEGSVWPIANLNNIQAPQDLRVIKIKNGKVQFSKFFRDKGRVIGPDAYFIIEPKTITYVGDLVVEWVYEGGGIRANILTIDREDETVGEVKKQYPWIFEEYRYRKNLPSSD